MKFFIIIFLLAYSISGYAELKEFDTHSFKNIEDRYQEEKFLVILWSVDCPPCMQEFSILQKLNQKKKAVNLILINVDGKSAMGMAQDILKKFSLYNYDNWIFADSYIEKLRYSIDRSWSGEVPRSYLYEPGKGRVTVSGMIPEEVIERLNNS